MGRRTHIPAPKECVGGRHRAAAIGLMLAAWLIAGCASAPPPATNAGPEPAAKTLDEPQQAAFERGAAALKAGDANRAVSVFEGLTRSAPESGPVHANLGTALMMRGEDVLATSAFERATALDDGLIAAYVRLGVLYRRSGRYRQAEAAYQAALARAPDHRYAHLNLGILYDVYLERKEQALTHYQRFQALSEQPDQEVALWIANLKQRR